MYQNGLFDSICRRKKVVRENEDFGTNWDLNVSAVWLRLTINLGRIVWRPVNRANTGLKVNRHINFFKGFFIACVLCSLRLLRFETEGQAMCKQKCSPKSYKIDIKVLADSWLVLSGFEHSSLDSHVFRISISIYKRVQCSLVIRLFWFTS